jgi:hypothetical protein
MPSPAEAMFTVRSLARLLTLTLAAIAATLAACSSGPAASGCTTDLDCKLERICVRGQCASASGDGGTPGLPPADSGVHLPPGDASVAPPYDADTDALANGVNIFCTPPDQGICYCGHDQSLGGTTVQSCTASLVGAGSLCCATTDWPSGGSCTCNGPAGCEQDYDTCQCSLAEGTPLPGDTLVSTCSYSGTCCQTSLAFGTVGCACYTETNIDCSILGGTTSSSCGPSDPGCGPGLMQTSSCR